MYLLLLKWEATFSSSVIHTRDVNLPRGAFYTTLCCPEGDGQTHHHGDWHEKIPIVWHNRINQWSNLRCPPLSYDLLEHYRQVAGLCWVSQLPSAENSSWNASRDDSVAPAAKAQPTGLLCIDWRVCTLTEHWARCFVLLPGILELFIPNQQKTDLLTLFVRLKIIFF